MTFLAKNALATMATVCAMSAPAVADQFIVTLAEPLKTISPALLDTLDIRIVDSFDHEGRSFAVIDARNDAYLEALFKATSQRPVALHALPVEWTGEAMADIGTTARLRFGSSMACGFCP